MPNTAFAKLSVRGTYCHLVNQQLKLEDQFVASFLPLRRHSGGDMIKEDMCIFRLRLRCVYNDYSDVAAGIKCPRGDLERRHLLRSTAQLQHIHGS